MAAAAASGHGKLLRGEPLAELEKTRPLSQEKFDEQYPANLLDELKGFDLVKYRAEREKVLRESHIKAIAFNEVLERYSSEAVLAVTAALKDCPGMLDRLRENYPLMRPTDRSLPSSPEHPDPPPLSVPARITVHSTPAAPLILAAVLV